jgi:heme-degrading monooxygenase HmoA
MAIKIIIHRKVYGKRQTELLPLLKELRVQAINQPGYLSGETLRAIDDPSEFLVISTWEKLEDWKSWESNPIRVSLQKKIDALLDEKTTSKAYCYS